jgi:hypothetical protein
MHCVKLESLRMGPVVRGIYISDQITFLLRSGLLRKWYRNPGVYQQDIIHVTDGIILKRMACAGGCF